MGEATHAATEKVFAFDACHVVTLRAEPAAPRLDRDRPPGAHRLGAAHVLVRLRRPRRGATSLGELLEEVTGGAHATLRPHRRRARIGKSRLLAELARRLDDRPELVTWRQGRCLPFGSNVTFWALSEIVRGAAGILESDGVARTEARLETLLPEGEDRDRLRARLRPLLGLEAQEASREENFSAWREFLEGLAASEPAVLVIEDLHWADEAMLAFMDYLAQSSAGVPLLVLATGRPEALELAGPGAGFVATASTFLSARSPARRPPNSPVPASAPSRCRPTCRP